MKFAKIFGKKFEILDMCYSCGITSKSKSWSGSIVHIKNHEKTELCYECYYEFDYHRDDENPLNELEKLDMCYSSPFQN